MSVNGPFSPKSSRRRRSRFGSRGPQRRLHVRLPGPVLTYERARRVLEALQKLVSRRTVVEVDLSRVREIAAPWTPVFGLLLWFVQRTGAKCVLTHANSRAEAMASLALGGGLTRDRGASA